MKNLSPSGVLALTLGLTSPAFAQDPAAEPIAPASRLEPEVSVSKPKPPPSAELPNFHLGVAGVLDGVARRAGAELSATYDVSRNVDLGLGVSLGESMGLLTLAQFHLLSPHEALFRPFVQLRGEFHPSSGGYGGGAWAGAELELGMGRLKAGPAVVVFAPRAGYHSYAVLGIAGFEFDLPSPWKPHP
ncbi:MAG: hypothetical protein ACJ8AT_25250 [Hyalangium sp.]|uniref:hypothetical protein n=1 Tax=Hyalangium sp. TaxID=2028555 RepID=UPI00389A12BE